MRNLSDFAVLRNMCLLPVAALKEFRQETAYVCCLDFMFSGVTLQGCCFFLPNDIIHQATCHEAIHELKTAMISDFYECVPLCSTVAHFAVAACLWWHLTVTAPCVG